MRSRSLGEIFAQSLLPVLGIDQIADAAGAVAKGRLARRAGRVVLHHAVLAVLALFFQGGDQLVQVLDDLFLPRLHRLAGDGLGQIAGNMWSSCRKWS